MYLYDEIQLDARKYTFLNDLPLNEYKNHGLPENDTLLSQLQEKYKAYIAKVIEYCEESTWYENIYTEDAKLNLYTSVVYTENLRKDLAEYLMKTPDVAPEVRAELSKETSITKLIFQLYRSNYPKRKAQLFQDINPVKGKFTRRDVNYLDWAIRNMSDEMIYDDAMKQNPYIKKLDEKLLYHTREEETDYHYHQLWDEKFFKLALDNDQMEYVISQLVPHLTWDGYRIIEWNNRELGAIINKYYKK